MQRRGEPYEGRDLWLLSWLGRATLSFGGLLIIALFAWTFRMSSEFSAMQKVDEAQNDRIASLELNGTPRMSAEATAKFQAMDARVLTVESGIRDIRTMLMEVLRRLPSGGGASWLPDFGHEPLDELEEQGG